MNVYMDGIFLVIYIYLGIRIRKGMSSSSYRFFIYDDGGYILLIFYDDASSLT